MPTRFNTASRRIDTWITLKPRPPMSIHVCPLNTRQAGRNGQSRIRKNSGVNRRIEELQRQKPSQHDVGMQRQRSDEGSLLFHFVLVFL